MKALFSAMIVAFTAIAISACDKDDNNLPSNEPEVISKVMLTLVDSATSTRYIFSYTDQDGDGGQPPAIDTLNLHSGSTYSGSIRVFDITLADTAIELTEEIADEAESHQFFYSSGALQALDIRHDDTDLDANGIYLGLKTKWLAKAPGSGMATIRLKHQPGQKQNGPKPAGDPAIGDTDMEIQMPFSIK